jgi:hypothetical protein
MSLDQLLEQKKTAICGKWFDGVIGTYAPDAAQFFGGKKDAFQNPVGSITRDNVFALYEGLCGGLDAEQTREHLDAIIRIRAIQNFTPSQAVGFVFHLKSILRKSLKKELQDPHILLQFVEFESRIDGLGLLAFNIYMECREKIFDLKKNVEKNKIYKAFARAGLVAEIEEDSPDLKFV